MSQGIFVRECHRCRTLVQTHDQTGKTPCDACIAKGKSIAPVIKAPSNDPPATPPSKL